MLNNFNVNNFMLNVRVQIHPKRGNEGQEGE
jgi:hypothetical protein